MVAWFFKSSKGQVDIWDSLRIVGRGLPAEEEIRLGIRKET